MRFARILLGVSFVFCFSLSSLAATYTVTKTADTNDGMCDADCSLREAIVASNGTAENDVINFSATVFGSTQTITLAIGEIVIANAGTLTINGTGTDKLTIDGNNTSRIISISDDAVVNISNIRFTRGNGAGAANTGRGGAIYNNGGTATFTNLLITGNSAANGGGTNHAGNAITHYINCVISNNTSTGAGGAMQNFAGSTLTMRDSTVSGNTSSSTLTGGGGIQANGTLTFTNTTFSGNSATGGDGGALYYNGQGLTMNNVTISANNATGGGSGGLHKSTTTLNANVRNSIFAGNSGSGSPDVAGAISSQGNNIIGVVGTSTGWIGSDLQNMNPLLSPLGFYGGNGMTHALLSGSPAINAGNNCVRDMSCSTANPPFAVTADQRGAARSDATVDIGAFEVNPSFVAVLPAASLNQAYSVVITPNRGTQTYSVTSGSLPPGLMLDSATSVTISGTPTQSGTFNFAITITNGTNTAVINYSLTVTSNLAFAMVGGRVVTSGGLPVRNAIVIMTDGSGNTRTARTNAFGYFRFDAVATGQTYTFSVASKQYQFQPQMVTVTDNITNLNFTAHALEGDESEFKQKEK